MEASSEIELHTGAEYRMVLGSPGSTGYVWAFEIIGPPSVIRIRQEYNEPQPVPDPSLLQTYSVEQAYVIEALGPGRVEVRLVFRRPWEKDTPPLQVKTVRVNVI